MTSEQNASVEKCGTDKQGKCDVRPLNHVRVLLCIRIIIMCYVWLEGWSQRGGQLGLGAIRGGKWGTTCQIWHAANHHLIERIQKTKVCFFVRHYKHVMYK
jgi:hypothetical protein